MTASSSPPPTWARPSSVPVRFMTLRFGQIFLQAFKYLGHNPRIGVVGGVLVPYAVSFLALVWVSFTLPGADAAGSGSAEELPRITDFLWASNLQSLVSITFVVLAQAYVLMNFREAMLGNRASTTIIFAGLRGRWGALIIWALIGIGAGIVFTIMSITIGITLSISAAIAGLDPNDMAALSIVLPSILIGIVLGSVPLIWVMTRLSLTPAALILDRLPLGGALKRSWQLTRRRFWRVFGIQASIWALVIVASVAVVAVCGLLVPAEMSGIYGLAERFGSLLYRVAVLALLSLLTAIGVAVSGYATGLLLVDGRMRDDWLATSLNGYTKARAAGVPASTLYDPFVSPPEAFMPQQGT